MTPIPGTSSQGPGIARDVRYLVDEAGASAVEYAIMAGLIAAVIVAVVTTLGSQVIELFSVLADQLSP